MLFEMNKTSCLKTKDENALPEEIFVESNRFKTIFLR